MADTDIKFIPQLPLTFASITIHPTSYIGEWTYNFPFYTSELSISGDGSFRFHEQGCLGHGYSEGRWTNYGKGILLTSADKYAYNRHDEQKENKPKTPPSTSGQKKSKDKVTFTIDTGSIANFNSFDTSNVYFDKSFLRLDGDTLFQIENNGLKNGKKYVLAKNNR